MLIILYQKHNINLTYFICPIQLLPDVGKYQAKLGKCKSIYCIYLIRNIIAQKSNDKYHDML